MDGSRSALRSALAGTTLVIALVAVALSLLTLTAPAGPVRSAPASGPATIDLSLLISGRGAIGGPADVFVTARNADGTSSSTSVPTAVVRPASIVPDALAPWAASCAVEYRCVPLPSSFRALRASTVRRTMQVTARGSLFR